MDLSKPVKRQRFNNQFYIDAWEFCDHDKVNIKPLCTMLNKKCAELCGMISPHGALNLIKGALKDKNSWFDK